MLELHPAYWGSVELEYVDPPWNLPSVKLNVPSNTSVKPFQTLAGMESGVLSSIVWFLIFVTLHSCTTGRAQPWASGHIRRSNGTCQEACNWNAASGCRETPPSTGWLRRTGSGLLIARVLRLVGAQATASHQAFHPPDCQWSCSCPGLSGLARPWHPPSTRGGGRRCRKGVSCISVLTRYAVHRFDVVWAHLVISVGLWMPRTVIFTPLANSAQKVPEISAAGTSSSVGMKYLRMAYSIKGK